MFGNTTNNSAQPTEQPRFFWDLKYSYVEDGEYQTIQQFGEIAPAPIDATLGSQPVVGLVNVHNGVPHHPRPYLQIQHVNASEFIKRHGNARAVNVGFHVVNANTGEVVAHSGRGSYARRLAKFRATINDIAGAL